MTDDARTADSPLRRMAVLSPFGVFPARSGGHAAVLEPARAMARAGVATHLFGFGLRKFEAGKHWSSFVREIEPGLTEERLVSWFNVMDYLRRGRSGLPALDAGDHLARKASDALRAACAEADAVEYSCPWLWPFRSGDAPRLFVAHNAEAAMLRQLDVGTPRDRQRAADLERRAWTEAEVVLCFTDDDRDKLSSDYGEREAHVVPLGVDTSRIRPPTDEQRAAARRELGLGDAFVVLFTGAWHLPNRAALDVMRAWAAAENGAGTNRMYVVAGSVGESQVTAPGLRITGGLPDLTPWFHAADCCINPVTTGSGANVKILEYLALGVPVVTTPFGARGIRLVDGEHALVRPLDELPDAVGELQADADLARALGAAGRELAVAERDWAAIARKRRELLVEVISRP